MSLKVTNGFLLFRCFLSRSVATDQFGSLIKRKNRAIIPGSLFSSQFRSCATSETGLKSKESLRSQVIKMAAGALPAEVKEKLDKIADVRIDETGRFKYILIKVFATDKDGKHIDSNSKLVVRGRSDCPYHGQLTVLLSFAIIIQCLQGTNIVIITLHSGHF